MKESKGNMRTRKDDKDRIVYHKKSIDNGDLSKLIPKSLIQTAGGGKNNDSQSARKTKNEKRRVTPLTITQKREKESKEFISSVNKVKKDQTELDSKLKTVPFSNKNEEFSIKNRLPKTIEMIEENEELVKMLLKNPDDMTAEEKIYISSFNNEEFKRFVEFLKRKNRELAWRGNDWGSGHYLDHYISIYRKSGHSEQERMLSLKKFLKLNYKNVNAEKNKKDLSYLQETKKNKFVMDDLVENADQAGAPESLGKSNTFEKDEMRNTAFEATSKIILKELESFKNILLSHKNEIYVNKIETQNNLIFKDLEMKSKMMKEDVEKMKNIKNDKKSEIDHLYEEFIKNKQNKEGEDNLEDHSAIHKIQNYCSRMNLSTIDLIKKLDINLADTMTVDMEEAKKSLIRLKVLNTQEAELLCNTLVQYHGRKIKMELLKCILDSEVYDEIEKIAEENEFDIPDVDGYNSNEEYDYFDMENELHHGFHGQNMDKKKKLLVGKQLEDFENMMKKKAALHVQRVYKGHLERRKLFSLKVFINLMAKRITKRMKLFTSKIKEIKNDSAYKITYLMRKNFILKNSSHKISKVTGNWLIDGKKIIDLPFSHKNKVMCAVRIQNAWRRYKEKIMKKFFEDKSTKLDMNMLKTKTCFICLVNRVSHLCRDCENNHYCESCFIKFHIRGTKRNHSYLKVQSLLDEMKKKKEKMSIIAGAYNENAVIKNYLEENNLNLYEVLKMWDFKKNHTILYKHLKDALLVRGFNFNSYIRDLIINIALKFVIDEQNLKDNLDNVSINYEALCLEFV